MHEGGIGEEHEKMNKGKVNGRKNSNLMDTEEMKKFFFERRNAETLKKIK